MTIREVAKRANVSIATVSRTLRSSGVVNDETAKRVMDAIKELNYRPNSYAQSLVSGRTRMLGLVVSDITNPFFPEVIRGFQDIALQNGYDVMMAATNYESRRTGLCIERMIDRKVDGVAIMTSEVPRSLTDQFSTRRVPLVFLDVGKVGIGVSNIKVDYSQGVTQALGHLLAQGHSRIAFISGSRALKSARVRREAFLRCLDSHGVVEHRQLVEEGNHRVDGGLVAAARLLQRTNPPTAILTSNDLTAIGAMRAIRQAGLRISEDVSVIGFDDIDMAQFTEPPLTTIRLARSELAHLACHTLLEAIGGKEQGAELHIGTQLVLRASTGVARTSRKVITLQA